MSRKLILHPVYFTHIPTQKTEKYVVNILKSCEQ
jgi:hypothetical protein